MCERRTRERERAKNVAINFSPPSNKTLNDPVVFFLLQQLFSLASMMFPPEILSWDRLSSQTGQTSFVRVSNETFSSRLEKENFLARRYETTGSQITSSDLITG